MAPFFLSAETAANTNPSAATLPDFLAALAIPFSLSQSIAFSISPPFSSKAFLQSSIPASLNSLISAVVIATLFPSYISNFFYLFSLFDYLVYHNQFLSLDKHKHHLYILLNAIRFFLSIFFHNFYLFLYFLFCIFAFEFIRLNSSFTVLVLSECFLFSASDNAFFAQVSASFRLSV